MSEMNPYNFSDDNLLDAEELHHRLKYQHVATIVCLLVWGIIHLVFDLKTAGTVHPHILAAAIGGFCHYVGKFCKVDSCLFKIREEIGYRRRLVTYELIRRDYMEAVVVGVSIGFTFCGAVEVLDFALGVHIAG